MPVPKLEANIRRGGLISTGKNITRGGLISTGKNGKRQSHKHWEYNKRRSYKHWENMARGGLITTGKKHNKMRSWPPPGGCSETKWLWFI